MPAAANTTSPETEKAKPGSPSKRANPVALEVLVSVTGARANNGGARELFTEETQTVLVFPDGAVIRLTAPVALGQLLFLANKGSNQEVVCQVLHARAFATTGAYVELQFTEDKGDYWGVPFPAEGKTEAEFSRKEHVEAQNTTEADPATVVRPHKLEDVDQLKQEVEALRKQLLELERKRKDEATVRSAPEKPKDGSAPVLAAMANLLEKFAAPSRHRAAQEAENQAAPAAGEHTSETPLMPAATPAKEPTRAVDGMSLPMGGKPFEAQGKPASTGTKDPAEELLPKPELDFSQMPVEMVNGVRSAYRARRAEFRKVTAPALVVLAVALAIVLWTMKPWKYLGGLRIETTASIPAKPAEPSAVVNKPFEAPGEPASASEEVSSTNSGDKTKDATETAGTKSTAESGAPDAGNTNERQNALAEKRAADEPKKNTRTKGKNARTEALSTAGNAGLLGVNDAPVLPAKLIKAANPVYPPDAMRSFITGDVRAEVVVEADGRIGEIKVLSGPKPLREAAVEALRQYQYAPATLGGKGVASRVTTTVKFWFNP